MSSDSVKAQNLIEKRHYFKRKSSKLAQTFDLAPDFTPSMNNHRDKITALILAGGQGSRFGFRDKGLIEWQSKLMIEHILDTLSPQADQIVISCNRNKERYQTYGWPCIEDQLNDYQGPLAGIQAGLSLINTPYCLTCPCDSPVLPSNLAQRLAEKLEENRADLAYVFDGNRKQYLLSLFKTESKASLNRYLAGCDRRVRGWHKQLNTIEVDFSENNQFLLKSLTWRNLRKAYIMRQLQSL